MPEDPIKKTRANGVDFAYLEKGEGPLVLCLHGFPDTAWTFQALLERLATEGYRAVAPFMRGYYPTGLAADGDYSVMALANDVMALIAALGEEKAVVIGHDWGSFAAYTAANIEPQRFEKLVLMCVPHMHNTTMSWAQIKKSWYVFFFQLPWLPEKRVSRDNFAFIDRLYKDWSPNWPEDEFALDAVKKSLAMPGGLKAALAYYRSMISRSSKEQRQVMAKKTTVPTLFFAGEADGSVGMDQFSDVAQAFSSSFRFCSYPGVGHFPHREAPIDFSQQVVDFLKTAQGV